MARDWLDIAEAIEVAYPQAIGGANKDETLRLQLVDWANDATAEIQKRRRWTLAYGKDSSVTTTAGTATYPIPSGIDPLDYVYWIDSSGYPQELENFSHWQLSQKFGEQAPVPNGQPRYFSFELVSQVAPGPTFAGLRQIRLYPTPDNSGPNSGNYNLIFEGYQKLTAIPIVETTGTVAAAPTNTLTVPSTSYLINRGVSNTVAGLPLSVRGAGFPQSATINDDFRGNVSVAITGGGTTVNTTQAMQTNVTNAQAFFNSSNWLITEYPKVLEFAVLREVATRLKDNQDFQKWEQRYEKEIALMEDAEVDRGHLLETWLTWTAGERVPQLRRLDTILGWEIRGATL